MNCFPGGSVGEEFAYSAGAHVQSLGQEDPLEKGMAAHPSTPWPGEFHEKRS